MDADIIVIGGGPSGMMAAISAGFSGANVLLIEKNKLLGKKLLLTGGGRCNVTNCRSKEEVIEHIPGNGKFLYSAFSQFDNHDLMAFLERNGVALKEEDHGRMFPTTDRSKTVVDALHRLMKEAQVKIWTNTTVKKLLIHDGILSGVQLENGERLTASCVIVATGGKTYPSTGSTGDGYRFAKKSGHEVTALFPTESPLISNDWFIQKRKLQGLALQDVCLHVLNAKGKTVVSHQMDLLFTHFGLSGPAALRCSMFVQQELLRQPTVTVSLDSLPQMTKQELLDHIEQTKQQAPNKQPKNALRGLLPERYLHFLLEMAKIKEDQTMCQLTKKEVGQFVSLIKAFPIQISQTLPMEKSFVTGGGVSLKQIQPRSLESKKVDGLYFVGEVLDINGYTGGYNVTSALVTGYVAGEHAAQLAFSKMY